MPKQKDKPFIDGIPDKEVVAVIQRQYPGYEKSLHSKVKRPDKYGVVLVRTEWMQSKLHSLRRSLKSPERERTTGTVTHVMRAVDCLTTSQTSYNNMLRTIRDIGMCQNSSMTF
jgi:hypothetical protein